MLLWLWCRPADAAPIQALARELPHAVGAALKSKKKKKKEFGEKQHCTWTWNSQIELQPLLAVSWRALATPSPLHPLPQQPTPFHTFTALSGAPGGRVSQVCAGDAATQLEAGGGGTGDGELVWKPSHVCLPQGHSHHLLQLPPESLGLKAADVLTCRHTPAALPRSLAPTYATESLLLPKPHPRSAFSIQPLLSPSRKDPCLQKDF